LEFGASFDEDTLEVVWTPGYAQAGSYQVTVRATDDGNGTGTPASSELRLPIIVRNANRAPDLGALTGVTVERGAVLNLPVQATDADGNVRRFIAANEGHCFPIGTLGTFTTYFAPADFNETANTLGQPLYAKQEPRKFERGTDLHTQSNPLPMCLRPAVLVKLTNT
jgi:hypothetical protein